MAFFLSWAVERILYDFFLSIPFRHFLPCPSHVRPREAVGAVVLDFAFVFSRAERVDESRALILVHVEGAVGHPAYQVVASVRLKVPWASHGRQFTKNSVTPPLLLVE